MRTVSPSAQRNLPPFLVSRPETLSAACVVRRSIFSLNRTLIVWSRSTPCPPFAGRLRTTRGRAATVAERCAGAVRRSPSASRTDAARWNPMGLPGASGASGTQRKRSAPAWPGSAVATSRPAVAGVTRSARATEVGSTGREKRSSSADAGRAVPSSTRSVRASSTVGRSWVKKMTRRGSASGVPAASRASRPIVTV